MRNLFYLLLVVISSSLFGEDLYLTPNNANGTRDGLNWTKGWANFGEVVWGSGAGELGAGDTLWLAAGEIGDATNATTLIWKGSGTSAAARIRIKRALASESACTSAAGWQASYDDTFIINKKQSRIGTYQHYSHTATIESGIRYRYSGVIWMSADTTTEMALHSVLGSHVILDGSEPGGILIRHDGMGRDQVGRCVWEQTSGVATDKPCRDGPIMARINAEGGGWSPIDDVTIQYVEIEGPARGAKYLASSEPREPVGQAAWCFERRGSGSQMVATNLTIRHCEAWGLVQGTRFYWVEDFLFEYNNIHTVGNSFPDGGNAQAPYNYSILGGPYDAPHDETAGLRTTINGTVRYNYIHHFTSPSGYTIYNHTQTTNIKIYGNVLYNPPGYTAGARLTGFISGGGGTHTLGPIHIFNNTSVGAPYPFTTASIVRPEAVILYYNNILIGANQWGTITVGDGEVQHDWSYMDQDYGGSNDDEPNRITGASENMFVGAPFSTATVFEDFKLKAPSPSAGTDVSSFGVTTDGAGVTYGADGLWDRGAFEYNASGDATAPTATWAIPSAGTTIVGTVSESISEGSGGDGGFTITASGGAVTASNVVGSGTTITITTSRTLDQDEDVTLSYTQPGDGIEDAAGNDMASFTDEAVANNSTQGSSPTIPSLSYSGFDVRDMLLEGDYTDDGDTITINSPASGFRARANITPPSNGDYTLSITFTAPAYSSDTFLLEIDGTPTDPADIVDLGPYVGAGETTIDASHRGTGAWNDPEFNPQTWTLTTSAATVTIVGREAGVVLHSASIALLGGSDTDPPTPSPVVDSIIDEGPRGFTIVATVASDPSGPVEYQFEIAAQAGGNAVTSDWQADPLYAFQGGLGANAVNARYRTRDSQGNASAWSAYVEAIIEAGHDGRPVSASDNLILLSR